MRVVSFGTRAPSACYIHNTAFDKDHEDLSAMESPSSPVVLVVEDEPFIRLDAVDTLTAAGFEVIDAANADEAIAVLEARPDIRAVVTDIQMPGSMDGLKLAATIHNRWPPIALIVTSGLKVVRPQELPERGRFLSKPYNATRLIEALRAAL
jgi:CheY-like chemotaxis protein